MSSKGNPSKCFVRVRPFTSGEALNCPEGSPIAREALLWDGKNSLTVLDPLNNFEPKKNGEFTDEEVLWGFKDPEGENDHPIVSQKDVYKKTIKPMIPSIVEGYAAAFIVAGGASSGRYYTFYGNNSTDDEDRGMFVRFTEDIFDAFEKKKEENSTIHCQLEAVDISGETYVDLMAVRKTKQTSVNKDGKETNDELKVQMGPEGARLSNVTTVDIQGARDFRAVVKQLAKVVKKKNCTHTVSLRFTETFDFEDPENPGQAVSKSRNVQVLFVILRNMPSTFSRVIDTAVEHDSGENTMAKVPVRETAFSKLYPSLFQQGFNLTFINCVSPYYEHVRETVNTLQFNAKVKKLRSKPKLNQDESLVEMRRLADEVKDLKVAARKQNQAMQLVQQELNDREVELMKQEANYNEMCNKIKETQENTALMTVGRNMEVTRTRNQKKVQNQEKTDNARKKEHRDKLIKDIDDSKVRTEENNKKIEKEKEKQANHKEVLKKCEKEEREVAKIEHFNSAGAEEQTRDIIRHSDLHKMDEEERNALRKQEEEVKKSDEAAAKIKKEQAAYDKAIAAEQPSREKDKLLKEIEQLEKDIAEAEAETKRLQAEIDAQKCCTMM